MPFADINILQHKVLTVADRTSPFTASFDNPVTAGSLVMFVGGALNGATDIAALLGTPSGGGTWESVTNGRTSGASGPNPFGALVRGLAGGAHTFSFPFTASGTPVSGTLRISGVLIEIGSAANPPLDGAVKTGNAAVGAVSTTIASGAMAQTDNLLIGVVSAYFGIPTNPSGWNALLTQQNGAAFPGTIVSWRKSTATPSLSFTPGHEAAVGVSTQGLLFVIKAADAGSVFYEFLFPSSGPDSMPASQGTLRAVIARNRDPFTSGAYEYYTGLTAEAGVAPGDATSRRVLISTGLPPGAATSDTLRASFETADASWASAGWIPGTVKAA